MGTYVEKLIEQKGLRKVDAKKPLVIQVLPADVRKAKIKNSKCCAFACAAKREFKATGAYFFRTTAWIEFEDKIVRYNLPPSVQKEIVSFDRTGTMEPGLYHLATVTPGRTMSAQHKRNMMAAKRLVSKLARKPRNHRTANVRSLFEPVL